MKKLLSSVGVVIVASYGSVALAQGAAPIGAQASSSAVTERAPTRAEVQADLAVWKRAGMERWTRGDSQNTFSPEYRAAFAKYVQMKNGPQYQEELGRFQGKSN